MPIDFHTHIFPEKIAEKTISFLEKQGNTTAFHHGCLSDLKQSMCQSGIDYSVVLPVVTKPSQFETINSFAQSINLHDGIFSFGGIHPKNDNLEQKLDYIKSLGLKGIKLHPDYQGCYIDDPDYLKTLRHCAKIGLLVTIHAGIDIGFRTDVHCPVHKTAKVLDILESEGLMQNPFIILAHLGGSEQWDAVEEQIVGHNVFLDLAFVLGLVPSDQLIRIINNHSAERILFATDSPWKSQKEDLNNFLSLPLTQEQKELILDKNAKRLLNIK
ncbi:MAG: TatD family hydrolase [bacterium]|nr:TatD family hydrolase [bacterium]